MPDDQKVPANNPGETFTLTTDIDTFIGGDGDDIFNATESGGPPSLLWTSWTAALVRIPLSFRLLPLIPPLLAPP